MGRAKRRAKQGTVVATFGLWLLAAGCVSPQMYRCDTRNHPPRANNADAAWPSLSSMSREAVRSKQLGGRTGTVLPERIRSQLPATAVPQGEGEPTDNAPPQSRQRSDPALVPVSVQVLPAPQKIADGKPVTLKADADVRQVLELLAREGNVNIQVSPGVSGRIAVKLENVSFHEALESVLKLANLAAIRENQLIYVYTPKELVDARRKGGRFSTRIYRLNYVRAKDLEEMIKPFLSEEGKLAVTPKAEVGIGGFGATGGASGAGGGGAGGGSGSSGASSGAGGTGGAGQETTGGDSLAGGETLIVQDYQSVLETADRIVASVDRQPMQIQIDALILMVTLDKKHQSGVNFAALEDNVRKVLGVAGSGAVLNSAGGFSPASAVLAGGKLVEGFAGDTHGLKVGVIDHNFTLFIRALEQMGKVNVLASPRLLVLNKQRAQLLIGDRLPFRTRAFTPLGTIVENVEFLDVGTQLRIRPFVTEDGVIRMEIRPERSSGSINEATQLPETSTTSVTSNVMVPNGGTIAIGGLIDEEKASSQNGVPWLSHVPMVGAMFRSQQESVRKRELVVLLTPYLCNVTRGEVPGVSFQPAPQYELVPPEPVRPGVSPH
jgi:type IV pilus secretin PilQ/predicted competence protein